jgi:cobalt-zinc-cadmium efflux system protein
VSDPTTLSRAARLWIVLGLNLGLVAGLLFVGIGARSLGVLAEAADYVADAAAIGVSILAIWLSGLPPTKRRPHGYPNATAWAALVNGGWLLLLTALVSAAAIHRLVSGTRAVHGLPVLIVSSVAAAVMVLGALILRGEVDDDGDHGGNLNMRAVLLDTAADAAAAAAVAFTGAIILATKGNYWLDPAVALVISAVIAFHAIQLLRRVVVVLRSGLEPVR